MRVCPFCSSDQYTSLSEEVSDAINDYGPWGLEGCHQIVTRKYECGECSKTSVVEYRIEGLGQADMRCGK